jgi:Asp/Glu/hydantoin racemase
MTDSRTGQPRIAMIHGLDESVKPARAAFAEAWPEAEWFDLLDASLASDLAAEGGQLDAAMMQRFQDLARYVAGIDNAAGRTAGLLFTCSAFGDAIEAVKRVLPIPVLRPNEAAFEQGLDIGGSIGLVVTFGPSAISLSGELRTMAAARGQHITIHPVVAEGAMAALKAGDGEEHDRLVAEAVQDLPACDVVILGQFSLARSRPLLARSLACPIITTPHAAVEKMRELTSGQR